VQRIHRSAAPLLHAQIPARRAPGRTTAVLLAAGAVVAAVAIVSTLSGQALWPQLAARLGIVREAALLHPLPALLLYLALFAAMTLACLPVGPASAMIGGALFGTVGGALAAIAAAVGGSSLLFLLARKTLGRWLATRHAPLLARLRSHLERDGVLGVLALRLAPVTPGWLISIAAGSGGMSAVPFVVASAIGIIPAFALFAHVGAGLGGDLLGDDAPALDTLLRPSELLPLLGLAALVSLPILLRAWRGKAGR